MMRACLSPKAIFIMRDPIDRYWSEFRYMYRRGQLPLEQFEVFRKRPGVHDRSHYAGTIDIVDDVFPPEDVLYLFYEDLFSESTVGDVARFLGIYPRWDWELDLVSNPGRPAEMPTLSPTMIEWFAPIYEDARERFGDRVPDSWRDIAVARD